MCGQHKGGLVMKGACTDKVIQIKRMIISMFANSETGIQIHTTCNTMFQTKMSFAELQPNV